MQPSNPRLIKRYVILSLFALVVLFMVHFIFTHGVAKISFTDGVQQQKEGTYYIRRQDDPQRKLKKLELPSNKTHYLRSGLYEVFLSNGREESVGYIQVPSFMRSVQLNITTSQQAASAKISSDSFGCTFAQGGVVYSYECSLPANIYRHTPLGNGRFTSRTPINELYYTNIAPYMNGILTSRLQEEENQLEAPVIEYLDLSSNQTTPIVLPNDERFEGVDELITDTSNPDSQVFALRSGNTLFTYTSAGGAVSGVTELPEEYTDAGLDRDSSINGNDLWVYFGLRDYSADAEAEAENREAFKGGVALRYSLGDGKETARIKLPEQLRAYGMRPTSNGLLFIDDLQYQYYERNDDRLGKLLAQNDEVSQVQRINPDEFLFIKDSRLFRFDAKKAQSNLLFESGHLNISSVGVSGRSYVMSAFVANDPEQVLHVYQINPEAAPQFPRREWSLPIVGDGEPILSMDYNDFTKQVVFVLGITSLEFSASAPPTFSQEEFDNKRQQVLDLLSEENIDLEGYSLVFREL